jgi:DNA-binding cell septation regulator SpoVG
MRKTWQYQVLTNFKAAIPGNREFSMLVNHLFKKYPEGFYVHLPEESRITNKRKIAKRKIARYVADSKLCVSETMRYIDGKDGFFITVMPRARSEDKKFREHIIDNKVSWDEVCRVQDPRKKKDPPEIWRVVESPIPSKGGFRIVWVWSSKKTKHDQKSRQNTINKAISDLKGLQKRLQSNRCRLKTKQAVSKEAEKIVEEVGANSWIVPDVVGTIEITHKQEKRSRPGPNTRHMAIERTRFQVNWEIDNTNVKADACSDGMFPLITNCDDISLKEILEKYKYQPKLEKRH